MASSRPVCSDPVAHGVDQVDQDRIRVATRGAVPVEPVQETQHAGALLAELPKQEFSELPLAPSGARLHGRASRLRSRSTPAISACQRLMRPSSGHGLGAPWRSSIASPSPFRRRLETACVAGDGRRKISSRIPVYPDARGMWCDNRAAHAPASARPAEHGRSRRGLPGPRARRARGGHPLHGDRRHNDGRRLACRHHVRTDRAAGASGSR
jgi:hypothetical protein